MKTFANSKKNLPVTLFKYSDAAILTGKMLTGTRLSSGYIIPEAVTDI